jgi:hypothetical protein
MLPALAFLLTVMIGACGGSSARTDQVAAPTGAPGSAAPDLGSYVCFRVEAPATKAMPAGPRGLCARSVDDCQLARRTVLDTIAGELGPTTSVPATECTPRTTAYCTVAVADQGGAGNACAPDPETCALVKTALERDGHTKTSECIEFPSSRLDLLAVRPIDLRMWCFRDQKTPAGADCEATPTACERMVNKLAAQGIVKPAPWADGDLCQAEDKVVCYPQLNRKQEQARMICTPSFEACQARAAEPKGADFQVLGTCGVVTGNKPW